MTVFSEHQSRLQEPLPANHARKTSRKSRASSSTGDDETEDDTLRTFPSFPERQSQRHNRRGLWTLLLLLALMTLGTRLFNLPLNRVIEIRYCREHYEQQDPSVLPPPDVEIPEEMCKIKEVQQRLAWLQGLVETFITGIDLAVTLPLGWVGDRFGRKVVLGLNAIGFGSLVFWTILVGYLDQGLPVEAILLGPIFTILGGHDCVLTSTIFAMVTDLTGDMVERTSYIAYITSVNYVISLFGPSLASVAMARNVWLPFYLSIGFFTVALPVIYSLPKAMHSHRSNRVRAEATDESIPEIESLLGSASSPPTVSTGKSSATLFQRIAAPVRALVHLVIGRRNFQIHLIGGFLLPALASSNTHLLPQYTSKRYGWKFEHVGYLLSAKAAVNITLLVLIIPTAMRILLQHMPGREVCLNFGGAQLSLAVSIVGALFISVAGSVGLLMCALIIYALGSALPVFTMSLVESAPISASFARSGLHSSHTLSHHDASESEDNAEEANFSNQPQHQSSAQQDYSVVMLVKTVGSLVGAPAMTFAWVKGIGMGGAALGLPYYLSAILYLGAAIVLLFLKL